MVGMEDRQENYSRQNTIIEEPLNMQKKSKFGLGVDAAAGNDRMVDFSLPECLEL